MTDRLIKTRKQILANFHVELPANMPPEMFVQLLADVLRLMRYTTEVTRIECYPPNAHLVTTDLTITRGSERN